jgi:hypothetical protein
MATANSSRGTRRRGRSGGNRPRTHASRKARRKPARPKPSKLHKAADALRDAARLRRKATPRATSLDAAAVDTPLEVAPSICALYEIRARLKGVAACIAVVVIGLKAQSADADRDFAVTLDLCVGDELSRVRDRVDGLIYPRGA